MLQYLIDKVNVGDDSASILPSAEPVNSEFIINGRILILLDLSVSKRNQKVQDKAKVECQLKHFTVSSYCIHAYVNTSKPSRSQDSQHSNVVIFSHIFVLLYVNVVIFSQPYCF